MTDKPRFMKPVRLTKPLKGISVKRLTVTTKQLSELTDDLKLGPYEDGVMRKAIDLLKILMEEKRSWGRLRLVNFNPSHVKCA